MPLSVSSNFKALVGVTYAYPTYFVLLL